MFRYLVSVIFKIDELAQVFWIMRHVGCKNGYTGVGSDTVESLFVERDNAFQSMVLEDVVFDILLLFGFACYGRLRNNDDAACFGCKTIEQVFGKRDFVQVWVLFGAL